MDLSKTGIFLLLFSNLAFELSSAGFIDVATINRPTLMRYAKPMHCNKKKHLPGQITILKITQFNSQRVLLNKANFIQRKIPYHNGRRPC